MIKPIKFSQRKVVNIEDKTKLDQGYLTKVKEYTKEMIKTKETNNQFIAATEDKFNRKMYLAVYLII
jgi:hypothetical protein